MLVAKTFATDPRVRREATLLANHGFEVQVLSWDRGGYRPPTEIIERCSVRNMKLGKTSPLAHSRLHYLVAAVVFQWFILLWLVRQIQAAGALIVHAHDFNTLLVCVVARSLLKSRVRLIYDCHELTPGVYQEWYGSFVSRIVGRIEFVLVRGVDAIVTANEAILDHLRCATAVPGAVIYCCPALKEVPEVEPQVAKKRLGLEGRFVVLFAGEARQDYDFGLMLRAAIQLGKCNRSEFRFLFIGRSEEVRSVVDATAPNEARGLFEFRGWVEDKDVLLYYLASDLCYAVVHDLGPNTNILTPIKLFESMACAVPVIVRVGTLAAELVKRWHCGIVAEIPKFSLSDELMRLNENREALRVLGGAGRKAFLAEYNWDLMEARLLGLYSRVTRTKFR